MAGNSEVKPVILLAALLAAQVSTDAPVLVRVDLVRVGAVCGGVAHYTAQPKNATLLGDLGRRGISIAVEVPCARLDAIDALLPLPSNRSGQLVVRTDGLNIHTRDVGACYADLVRSLTPVDSELLIVVGAKPLAQRIDPVACARLPQALVGAQITAQGNWPVAHYALPFPLKP